MSGLFPHNDPIPIIDTKTNKRYTSKGAASRDLAREFGLAPEDRFVTWSFC